MPAPSLSSFLHVLTVLDQELWPLHGDLWSEYSVSASSQLSTLARPSFSHIFSHPTSRDVQGDVP